MNIDIDDLHVHYRLDTVLPEGIDHRHCHDRYEILYLRDGSGKCVIEGRDVDLQPGTVIIVKPLVYHNLVLDPNVNYERYVLQFNLSSLVGETAEMLTSSFPSGDETGGLFSCKSIDAQTGAVFERFDTVTSLPEPKRRTYMRLLISQLMILLTAAPDTRSYYDRAELGARVIEYLNGNIDRSITLDELSRRFFVSKYYLCRAFKKHNGISVHGYINQKRIMYAKQLIELGETASGAAYKVGFGDYSAFYRAYVKIIGKSPTE